MDARSRRHTLRVHSLPRDPWDVLDRPARDSKDALAGRLSTQGLISRYYLLYNNAPPHGGPWRVRLGVQDAGLSRR